MRIEPKIDLPMKPLSNSIIQNNLKPHAAVIQDAQEAETHKGNVASPT
jgi:hypothetical protein